MGGFVSSRVGAASHCAPRPVPAAGGETVATTDETTVTGGTDSTSGKNTPGADTPDELAACLEQAGYDPTVIPAPPEGAPGSEFGSVGSVRVDISAGNGVAAVFFENAKRANELSKSIGKSALSGQGSSEVIGSVYVSANKGKPKELDAFRDCLKG